MSDFLISLDQELFLKWIREGILLFRNVKQKKKINTTAVIVSLPPKYEKVILNGDLCPVLIDDMQWCISTTRQKTIKLASEIRNLSEKWLPFKDQNEIYKSNLNKVFVVERILSTSQSKKQRGTKTKMSGEGQSNLYDKQA